MFALNYALTSLGRRKQKNIATILAVALGVGLFAGVAIGNKGIKIAVIQDEFDSIQNVDIIVGNSTGMIPTSIGNLLNGVEEIKVIDPRIRVADTQAYSKGEIENNIRVVGIDPNLAVNNEFGVFYDLESNEIKPETMLQPVPDGNFTETGNAIISKLLKERLNLEIGSTVLINIGDGNGTSIPIYFIVSAFFDDTKGRGLEASNSLSVNGKIGQIYIHLDEFQQRLIPELRDSVDYLAIMLDEKLIGLDRSIEKLDIEEGTFPGWQRINDVINEIEDIFELNEIEGIDLYSKRLDIALIAEDEVGDFTGVLNLFVYILNSIALLLIINVQTMSVDDRKNQTAILRALGSNKSQITLVFLIEALILGIVGALGGILFGAILGNQLITMISQNFNVAPVDINLSSAIIIQSVIFGIVLSIITSVLPAIAASRQSIANSLRGIPDVKKESKGYLTVVAGFFMVLIGLMFSRNAGEFWTKDGWRTFEDQQAIIIGFGLTIAGMGMLLTVIINRKVALNISGITLWGLAIFNLLVSIKWVEEGNANNSMTAVMFYSIIGSSLIISQNYNYIMKGLSKFLFLFPKLRGIAQVTTRGMVGRKTRGVLVFTIFSIILTLNIFIISTSESLKIGMVQEYDWRGDGVDIVVDVETAVPGIADAIKASDVSVENVFSFRRTWVPVYLEDISVNNLAKEPSEVLRWRPLIEVPEEIINPDNWEDNSLKLSFLGAISGNDEGSVTQSGIKVGGSPNEHHSTSQEIFDSFYSNQTREITKQYDVGGNSPLKVTETQRFTIGGMFTAPQFEGLLGSSMYLETRDGTIQPMYIGASTGFDMLGVDDFFGWGFLITPDIANSLPEFDEIKDPNVFLVRSNNGYNDEKENNELASKIEKKLNDIEDNASLSFQSNVFIGATTQVVKEVAVSFWRREANFWDFLAVFSSLGLIIGTIGMSIIAVRSVSERIREIGMMRAIGFSRQSVVQGVVVELLVLAFLGLIVGIINGVLFTIAIAKNLFETQPVYPIPILSLYVFGVFIISIVAGALPGYNASKITPSEALRYTG